MSERKLSSDPKQSVICVEGGNPRPGLRSKDLRLNTSTVHKRTKISAQVLDRYQDDNA
jgi:hypothetical protein